MRSKLIDVAVLIGITIIVVLWTIYDAKYNKDSLNQSDIFAYIDSHELSWFELTNQIGKVEGKFHQHTILEEVGQPPILEEKTYSLTGDILDKGFLFEIDLDGEIVLYDALFTGASLLLKEQGENEHTLYKSVDAETLKRYVQTIQEELEYKVYHSEKKEKDRIMNFFNELKGYDGFLYENESILLFITFDEALYEGELSGSLLMLDHTLEKSEASYPVNGITDGIIIKLYTTIDGKEMNLEGNFLGEASRFDMTFWMTDEKITFQAITEDEFNKRYEEVINEINHQS